MATGTVINALTVLAGGGLGALLGQRLPERVRETVMAGLGLVTLIVGLQLALETENVLVVLVSVLLGALLGEWWRIDVGLERLSDWLKGRLAGRASASSLAHFNEGFITASLVFCVGPMTILGSLEDGLTGDYSLLAIKAVLDGFAALAFASSLGIGVLFSVVTVVVYQGGLTLLAGLAEGVFSEAMIREMSATGGVLVLAIGLMLLNVKQIRVANLLPSLGVVLAIVAGLEVLGIAAF
ncbi:MAG: DUF554 domain-containing protein [Chloroflexi bacterium]|nr:DUF554 domain-containing protein [Chloroflexota bacterium]